MAERIDTPAIVIQRFAYGETSQIVHLLTQELGRVVVLARGAFRPKNDFEGPLDLLVRGEVTLALVEGRELGQLLRRRITTAYPALRSDLVRFQAASHLLGRICHFEPVGGGGEGFRLVERALAALETCPSGRVTLLLLAFDAKFAAVHGIAPVVDGCVRCGSSRSLARFVAADGGVVCSRCLVRPDEGERIDRASAALLAAVLSQSLARIPDPAPATLSRARRLIESHLAWHADTAVSSRRTSPRRRPTVERSRSRG